MIPIYEHMNSKRVARFNSRIEWKSFEECWPWRARRMLNNYGVFSIEPTGSNKTLNFLAHRVALSLFIGRDATDLVLHACDNPPCCNPFHLFEGDHQANTDDMVAKGRAPKAAHLLGVYGPAHPASHFTHPERERALALFQEGHLRRDIATAIGCSRQIVSHWIYDAFPQSVAMPAGMKRMRKSSE